MDLSLNLSNIDNTLIEEAGPVVMQIATAIVNSRTNTLRPTGESMAAKSIRGVLRGDFQSRLVAAMTTEERTVQQNAAAISAGTGATLDGIGGSLGIERNRDELDVGYRIRLETANDLELQPLRSAFRTAAENLTVVLLGAVGPVLDVVNETVSEMAQT